MTTGDLPWMAASPPAMLAFILPPYILMVVAMVITVAALLVQGLSLRKRHRDLTELAKQWGMNYSPRDAFELAARVATHLPAMGAADVQVSDLIYGTETGGHRYIFVAEFTVGIVRVKSRRRCVVSLLESKAEGDATVWSMVKIAPMELPLVEQYRTLHDE